jgi:hypothetical protein
MTCPHVHRTFRPASSAFHKNRFPQEMHWNLSPVAGGVIIQGHRMFGNKLLIFGFCTGAPEFAVW